MHENPDDQSDDDVDAATDRLQRAIWSQIEDHCDQYRLTAATVVGVLVISAVGKAMDVVLRDKDFGEVPDDDSDVLPADLDRNGAGDVVVEPPANPLLWTIAQPPEEPKPMIAPQPATPVLRSGVEPLLAWASARAFSEAVEMLSIEWDVMPKNAAWEALNPLMKQLLGRIRSFGNNMAQQPFNMKAVPPELLTAAVAPQPQSHLEPPGAATAPPPGVGYSAAQVEAALRAEEAQFAAEGRELDGFTHDAVMAQFAHAVRLYQSVSGGLPVRCYLNPVLRAALINIPPGRQLDPALAAITMVADPTQGEYGPDGGYAFVFEDREGHRY